MLRKKGGSIMGNTAKIWIIVAISLVLIGCILFVGALSAFNWDFKKLSTVKFETNTYNITNEFSDISLKTNTADIVFLPSENQQTTVICHEEKNLKHSVAIKDNVLVIEVIDTRKWYEHIGINFENAKITVYIPQGKHGALSITEHTGDVKIAKDFEFKSINVSLSTGDVTCLASALEKIKIKTSTGDVTVENATCHTLELSSSTGNSYIRDFSCRNINSRASTGYLTLDNVIATEKLTLIRDTGDIKLKKSDAGEIFIKTDTGNVIGSLISDKVFITKSDTGTIKVPKTTSGGKCEITTDTGNINIKMDY